MGREKLKEEEEEIFKKGVAVEVSSEDEGLRGSWYTATVIRTNTQTSKILVEYHNLVSDEQTSRKLQEFVDPILIRPIPPSHGGPSPPVFRLMDDVDAFHHDGWWEGVVTRVLLSDDNFPRYSVFFRCSREQIEFSPSDLRLHREWLGSNKWVPSPFPSPSSRTRLGPSLGGRASRR